MGNRGDTQLNIMLRKVKRRRWQVPLLLCLALLVTAGVAGIFHLPAIAKTYQVTELTCAAVPSDGPAYADFFVHIHNDDCYDAEGKLVCPLPEILPHRHTADCFVTTRTLICSIPESNGHQHTGDCFTRVRGDLICELPTEPVLDAEGNVIEEGHVHTDECYAWSEKLNCDMEMGEGAHHHDDSCYETSTTLTCEQPEVLLHTHTDSCYQKNEDGSVYMDEDGNTWLICGKLQVTEHIHGPECFTTYELDDGEPEFVFMEEENQPAEGGTEKVETDDGNVSEDNNTDPADDNAPLDEGSGNAEEAENAEAHDSESANQTEETATNTDNTIDTENIDAIDETEPNADEDSQEKVTDDEAAIAEEYHTVVYTSTRGAENGGMTVLAEIPEGALDEKTQLILSDADENAARKQILKVVNENVAEGEEREISSMLLMDIDFVSDGEPAVLQGTDPIRITLRAAAIRGMSAPRLFHLSSGTAQEVEDVLFDTQAGSVVFTSTTFSTFVIVDLAGEYPAEETAEETVSVSMPAQSFTGETDGVLVSVEAPEGAFPEGTTMIVSPVEMDDDTLSNITDAVESSGDQKLVTAQAIDISFFDADQNMIEPKLPIKVSMKSALVSESGNVALVHLTEADTAETAEDETFEAPAAPVAEIVSDVQVVENPDEGNEIQFESDAFSVYVLVGTETITTNYITADGETYTITVTCGPEAMIPAGATLAVKEIPQNSEEYANYLAQAQNAVKADSAAGETGADSETAEVPEDATEATEESCSIVDAENTVNTGGTTDSVTVTTARFFDITILNVEGNPIEPAALVDVKIEYMEPAESAENYQVVHFGEETEVLNPAVSGTDGTASTFDFQASSFSVFGIVGTKTITMEYITVSGETYSITVTYGPEAGIPDGAELKVREILQEDEKYQEYLEKTAMTVNADFGDHSEELEKQADTGAVMESTSRQGESTEADAVSEADGLGKTEGSSAVAEYVRIFDIEIMADGEKIEPASPVRVSIRLLDAPETTDATPKVVHFASAGPEVMTILQSTERSSSEGTGDVEELSFLTQEFSVYSVIYTVDFSFEVDGKVYTFSLRGEDAVSLRTLLEALHVYELDYIESAPQNEQADEENVDDEGDQLTENDQAVEQDNHSNPALDRLMDAITKVSFSDESLLAVIFVEKETTLGELKAENHITQNFAIWRNQGQVEQRNSVKFHKDDWALVSLKPFRTNESLMIELETGESFTINVTDEQNANMQADGIHVDTITNPAGTTIDLYNYWISDDLKNNFARTAWPGYYDGWYYNDDNNYQWYRDGTLLGTGNNSGINAEHMLKFSPAWAGTVYDGTIANKVTGAPGQSPTRNPTNVSYTNDGDRLYYTGGVNSYTGNGDPTQGLVEGTLVSGYPKLTSDPNLGTNGESLAYLFEQSNGAYRDYYGNVDNLLYVDPDGYYTYDSRDYTATLNGSNFELTEQTSTEAEVRGFWPFGQQIFWVGMHMNTQFSMPTNGQVLNPKNEYKDMQFEFSGDDDTWLYIDGVLVGDGGGIHNRTEIDINFANGTVTVTGKKDTVHGGTFEETKYLDDLFRQAELYNDDDWEEIPGSSHKRFKAGTYHTFDMFYLERGGGESNLYIHYNLVSTADFTGHKSYEGFADDERMARDQFQFELIGLDGQYQSVWNSETQTADVTMLNESGHAIMPTQGTESGAGTVASPKKVYSTQAWLGSDGQYRSGYVYTTGVTEDGNINFGTAEINESEMHACDEGHPSLYRYVIREVVPDDAVNDDGVTWADATDEQKAAGGFVKDQVKYDARIYYMTARVTSWDQTGTNGQTYKAYGLSKTYYTDDTFSTVDPSVTFVDFRNLYAPGNGNVEFTKVDGANHPLQGAEFTLYTDAECTKIAKDLGDVEANTPGVDQVKTSGADGKIIFENMAAPRTYYMKETIAPAGYEQNNTVYKVIIESSKDTTKSSRIIVVGDDTETPMTKIVNTKEGEINVIKEWQDQNGNPVSGGNLSARVKLQRYKYQESIATTHNVSFTIKIQGHSDLVYTYSASNINGSPVTIDWWDTNQDINSINVTDSNGTNIDYQLSSYWDATNHKNRKLSVSTERTNINAVVTYPSDKNWLFNSEHTPWMQDVSVSGSGVSYELVPDTEFNSSTDPSHFATLASPDWSKTWTIGNGKDFPASDGANAYRYYVVEVDEAGNVLSPMEETELGYKLKGYSANNAQGVEGQGAVVVYNEVLPPQTIDIVVKKTDNAENSTNYLEGAVFRLEYRAQNSGPWTNVSNTDVPELDTESKFTVPKAGITLTGLKAGQYRLHELAAPAGYVITEANPVVFMVQNGAIADTEGTITSVRYTAASGSSDAEFIIPNVPGVQLPQTGGAGTALFTAIGGIMTVLSGATLTLKKRRAHA